ncbi:ATP-dependent Clp protease adapter ClpS [Bartonella sp. HY329]|uniref:ATP-dependent Clp protease adapter ClpS n=1 Tax=unclassified Bartonella TaxID=2645622 RepID=UPI0021C6A662|nr:MULTISPECIES: ATP-dependent Clp protease adapter ClpS [unclassified Bartonella]UXM94011.1 ATP-dependent Clp protease adapter ClpS [Bartonella sp. HY329]UXN08333.1 ATP-dependent Clp protease adapter ClpS [Bartonella sp. HY328]
MQKDSTNSHSESDSEIAVEARTRPKIKKPNLYRVILLNDDYTPMNFVIDILLEVFHKTLEEATAITFSVHHLGAGECGIYTYEVAEEKVNQVLSSARKEQHPLQCIMEKK